MAVLSKLIQHRFQIGLEPLPPFDRSLVDRRIWPAIDINASGTRREEILMDKEEHKRVSSLRRILGEMNAADAMEKLTGRMEKSKSNAEFLMGLKPE